MYETKNIITYTNNKTVIKEVEKFSEKHKMNVVIANTETDLVAFSFWLAVIDINLLEGVYFRYLEDVNRKLPFEVEKEIKAISGEEDLGIKEKIISHTKGNIPAELTNQIIIQEHITSKSLEALLDNYLPIPSNVNKKA